MTDDPRGPDDAGHGRRGVVPLGAGLIAIAALAALVRWSLWWPHSDMRQLWANAAIALAAVIGVTGILVGFRRLDPEHRRLGALLAVGAVVLGLLVGFPVMREATAWAR